MDPGDANGGSRADKLTHYRKDKYVLRPFFR